MRYANAEAAEMHKQLSCKNLEETVMQVGAWRDELADWEDAPLDDAGRARIRLLQGAIDVGELRAAKLRALPSEYSAAWATYTEARRKFMGYEPTP